MEDRFVVVLDVQDVFEQPRVFQTDRDLRGERAQPRLVLLRERAVALVEHLGDPDPPARFVDDRRRQDRAGDEPGAFVDLLAEPRVGIGIGDVFGHAAGEHRACDPLGRGDADFARFDSGGIDRDQLVALGIVDEQRRAFGVEQFGGDFHDPLDQHFQLQLARKVGTDRKNALFVA